MTPELALQFKWIEMDIAVAAICVIAVVIVGVEILREELRKK